MACIDERPTRIISDKLDRRITHETPSTELNLHIPITAKRSMKIDVIPAAELSAEHLAIWSHIQRSEPTLNNPFFRPEFTLAVAAERSDVRVAVWEQSGEPAGFLPFERSRRFVAQAVGSCMNLAQGAIVRSDLDWSPRDVVRAAGLRGFRFDNLLSSQRAFAPFQYVVGPSAYLDLSQGFEHYHKGRGKSAATAVSHIFQKERKAGRELGEVRLEINPGRAELHQLLEWKIAQCRAAQSHCLLGLDWVIRLHEQLLEQTSEDFSGMLFCLKMGDRLAAAFYCLRSRGLLQGSILGYDRDLGAYAPGFVIVMRVAQIANSLGITRIDLGSGGGQYKDRLASDFDQVSEGVVTAQRSLAPLYRNWIRAKDRLRTTRLGVPARRVRYWMLSARKMMGYTD
jgi:CelD/BcsL family acetyltransferase involved in cellulose biosynthesis